MINNILISRKTRKVISKDNRFIGIEGENLQEVLVFNLDEELEGVAVVEILFPDETTGYIELEKTERGYELPVKSSLLTQEGIVKMQLRIMQSGQEIFKSEIIRFNVEKAINATATIPEEYPTWIDNLTRLKQDIEKSEEKRVLNENERTKAEQSRVNAENERVKTFSQMQEDIDNVVKKLEDYATKEYVDNLIGDIEKELGGI